jgi:hypothetical protein
VGDPSGTSFLFSIKPKIEAFMLVDKPRAILCIPQVHAFGLGAGCLLIREDGTLERHEATYAVPKGWARGSIEGEARPKIGRFEIWRLTTI